MRRAAITLLAAGMSAASPAAAGAPGPQRLGDPPVTNEAERYVAAPIATGSDGRAVALIQSGARVVVRNAGRGRAFGPVHPVALGDHALAPAVAVAGGFAALAWTHDPSPVPDPGTRGDPCCRRLRTAVVDRAGRVAAVRTLSASRAADAQAALVTARGARAAVTWTDARGLRVSTATSSTGFRRP